jgi:hypothetical protein
MSTKRSVILQGGDNVVYNEEGAASAQVKPGYLVKGVSTIAHQTSTDKVPAAFAVERDELGAGIDNTYQTSGTISAFYASGDTVKVAVCPAGTILTAYIASGQNIQEDELLDSAGDGTLKTSASDDAVVARSLETVGAVTTTTALRVQVV